MNKKYIIRWKSKVNGRTGQGTKLFARDEAEQLVDELNREYPQIEHEPIETSDQTHNRLAHSGSESINSEQELTPSSEPTAVLSFQE
jgi:hypothetical protein